MSQCLVTKKGAVIIYIGILRSKEISHNEIETQRESILRGRNLMEASILRYGEIRLIIVVVATIVWNQQ